MAVMTLEEQIILHTKHKPTSLRLGLLGVSTNGTPEVPQVIGLLLEEK
jgi:hypothetical protein